MLNVNAFRTLALGDGRGHSLLGCWCLLGPLDACPDGSQVFILVADDEG